MYIMFKRIAALCKHLDEIGLHDLSDSLDVIIRLASDEDYFGDVDAPPEELPGACSNVAEHLARHIVENGMSGYFVVEGKVALPDNGRVVYRDHTWVVSPNGVIDPTGGQFSDWGDILGYIPEDIYSPHEFVSLCEKDPLPGDWFPDAEERIDNWMTKVVPR